VGSVHVRQVGVVVWNASIDLGIGDDDTVCGVAASDHATEQAARAWVEEELPRAEFPAWVARRPHGVAGAFLYGSVTRGYLAASDPEPSWEPDLDAPSWDADLVNGAVHWHRARLSETWTRRGRS
jgi:hypothetical protein